MNKFLFFLWFSLCILSAIAQPSSGKCGKYASWTLRNDSTIIIYGTGDTYDFSKKPSNSPFVKNGMAEKVTIADFSQFTGKINDNLFYGCIKLSTIIISESQRCSFSSNAFNSCTNIVTIEVVPTKTIGNRYRILTSANTKTLQKYNIPIASIQTVIINCSSQELFKPIKPFPSINTYSSLRSKTEENIENQWKESILGQWKDGGWNGVVQRTTTTGDGYFKYIERQIAVEVDGRAREDGGWPYEKIEKHTDLGPTNTDVWDIEERLGNKKTQHDYYHIEKDGTERLFCQILKMLKKREFVKKYKCIFPNGECFIANKPSDDPNLKIETFKGLIHLSDGSFYYGDFDCNTIAFEDVRSYGLLYPLMIWNSTGTKLIGPVKNISDILNIRNGKGVYYDKNLNNFLFGLWENGQYKGSPDVITIDDLIDCPETLPLDYLTKLYVEKIISIWEKKDEFESTQDWQTRTAELNRKKKIEEVEHQFQYDYLMKFSKNIHLELQLSLFNADNKCFPISDKTFGKLNVYLSGTTPQIFKSEWNKIVPIPTFYIHNNKIDLLHVDFLIFDEQIGDYRKVAYYHNSQK